MNVCSRPHRLTEDLQVKPAYLTRHDRLSFLLIFLAVCLVFGCASPVAGLWPPQNETPVRTITVSLDSWHAMIALPHENRSADSGLRTERNPSDSEPQSSALAPRHLFEEWGYAEQAWYLEGRTEVTGIIRALFWPTPGVIEVGVHDRVWADRTPQPPAERFFFQVSAEGYARLLHYLQSSIADSKPVLTAGSSRFYQATRFYHLFHHCHQYAALALREAGLPLSPSWALTRNLFAMQLRRAEQLANKAAAPEAP